MRAFVASVLCFTACLLLSACSSGPRTVKVTGKVTNKGKPLNGGQGGVTLVFHSDTEKGNRYPADPPDPATGAYEVAKIPEGKYRVEIQVMSANPTAQTQKINQQFTPDSTPIVREVKGDINIDIDVAKPQG
ncbi:MAG: hypothetical protein IT429_19885 [Gemmataceae bacterium]|nr:hypothetical protein [Gemmataceae bacterium]